jgi:hypothetical protein
MDAYILKFPQGSTVPAHIDPVETGRHYRLNIVLKKANGGGETCVYDPCFHKSKRLFFFRPDTVLHGLSKVWDGTLYILSIGWIVGGE